MRSHWTRARHLAWFNTETGGWIGEWMGHLPAPVVPSTVTEEGRLQMLNAWLQDAQRLITPAGSPYAVTAQLWDLDAWDDCPDGAAVCLDTTRYGWPVGDFQWAVFDGWDRLLDFREMRAYLELTPATAMLDASVHGPRPVRSTPEKIVADVTGTPLEPWVDQLHGRLIRRDGRIVFEPFWPGVPEAVVLSITDRTLDLALLGGLEHAAIPLAERN